MPIQHIRTVGLICLLTFSTASCSGGSGSLGSFGGNLFGGGSNDKVASAEDVIPENAVAGTPPAAQSISAPQPQRRGLFEGKNRVNPDTTIQVNKYIWSAALEVLNFLPIQSADPFTGVIVTGYGTPPGGGQSYRATVFIQDPALDARSLRLALQTRGGPASTTTIRAVEDAILTRARQLRVADRKL